MGARALHFRRLGCFGSGVFGISGAGSFGCSGSLSCVASVLQFAASIKNEAMGFHCSFERCSIWIALPSRPGRKRQSGSSVEEARAEWQLG